MIVISKKLKYQFERNLSEWGNFPPPKKKEKKILIDLCKRNVFSFTFLDFCWLYIKEKLPKGWMSNKN